LLLCSSYLALGVPNCLAIIIIINYTPAINICDCRLYSVCADLDKVEAEPHGVDTEADRAAWEDAEATRSAARSGEERRPRRSGKM
jgi:hypothetical protein